MMGEQTVTQEVLFYEFSLERHVPSDHLLRSIDRFIDLSGIRAHLQPFYSAIGHPSIDPELMIRMLIIGYCFGETAYGSLSALLQWARGWAVRARFRGFSRAPFELRRTAETLPLI